MTDYTKSTGDSGVLIIRDNGSTVTFLLKNTYSGTYAYGKGWSGYANGNRSGSYSISGSETVTLGSWSVPTSQTVSLTIAYSGTSGLAGPTTLSVAIHRATIPSAPRSPSSSSILPTSFAINFNGPASNGGASIDYYLVRISLNSSFSGYTDKHTGTGSNNVFTGLTPGTTYYSRVYAHNSKGYSTPSVTITVKTLAPARIKVGGVYKFAIPYVKVAGIYRIALPFVKTSGTYKQTI